MTAETIENVGIAVNLPDAQSDLPFAKADFVQVCRIDDSYAVTFHQLDYQHAADSLTARQQAAADASSPIQSRTRIVGRIVLSQKAYDSIVRTLGAFLVAK